MPLAKSTVDLISADSPEPFVLVGGSVAHQHAEFVRLQKLFASFERRFGISLELENHSGFQDGSLFTCAREAAGTPGGIAKGGFYFSRYGSLFTGGRESPASRFPLEAWANIRDVLSSEERYVYVSNELLKAQYDGEHQRFSRMTWDERLFSAFYSKLVRKGSARPNTSLERTRGR